MFPIDFLWRSAIRNPDDIAVIHPGGTLDFANLAIQVLERARVLNDLDAQVGSPVAVGMGNSLEHVLTILAVLAAGKIWTPLNPRNGDPELQRIIQFVAPALIVADDKMAERLSGMTSAGTAVISDLGTRAKQTHAAAAVPSSPNLPLHATQAIKFTGGSTGVPKGVMQPYRAWNANIVTQIHEYGLDRRDRYLIATPLTHGASTYLLPLLAVGGSLVVAEANRPGDLLDLAEQTRATITFAPPTLILGLMREQAKQPRALNLRYLVYAGAPMRPHEILEAQEIFGPILAASYGQTEAPQIVTFMPPALLKSGDLASVGRPSLMTKVAISTADGEPAKVGEEGEIVVQGDLIMSGYYRAEDETRRVLKEGRLHTGDLGLLDDRGFLFMRGRTRDVIITGGFNVYPSDVEAIIAADPAVADCVVVGVADDKWGESVQAAIQVKSESCVDLARLAGSVRTALGSIKTPKSFHIFDELPRTPVGKHDKATIIAEVARRLVSASEKPEAGLGGHA